MKKLLFVCILSITLPRAEASKPRKIEIAAA